MALSNIYLHYLNDIEIKILHNLVKIVNLYPHKQSAQMIWANKNLGTLYKDHRDIVKSDDSDDLSYKLFRNFVLKEID